MDAEPRADLVDPRRDRILGERRERKVGAARLLERMGAPPPRDPDLALDPGVERLELGVAIGQSVSAAPSTAPSRDRSSRSTGCMRKK